MTPSCMICAAPATVIDDPFLLCDRCESILTKSMVDSTSAKVEGDATSPGTKPPAPTGDVADISDSLARKPAVKTVAAAPLPPAQVEEAAAAVDFFSGNSTAVIPVGPREGRLPERSPAATVESVGTSSPYKAINSRTNSFDPGPAGFDWIDLTSDQPSATIHHLHREPVHLAAADLTHGNNHDSGKRTKANNNGGNRLKIEHASYSGLITAAFAPPFGNPSFLFVSRT